MMTRNWRVAKSLDVLLAEVNRKWPGRPKSSDGSIGDVDHARRTSDHNPWVVPPNGGVVTARDFTEWVVGGVEMNDMLVEFLRASRDPRIKYVISDGRMFSSYPTSHTAAWQWRPYSGSNDHRKHVHVSVQAAPGLFDSTRPWGLLAPAPAQPVEDVVNDQDKADIINGVTANLLAKLMPSGGIAIGEELDRVRRTLRKLAAQQGVELNPETDA